MVITNDRRLLVAASYVGGESGPSRDTVTLAPSPSLDQRRRGTDAVRRVVDAARRAASWFVRQRDARRNVRQLGELDSRTLRDLGLTRSELASVVAEVDGYAETTRRRIEASFIASASSGLRVRNLETYMSLGVLIGFGSVLLIASLSTAPVVV